VVIFLSQSIGVELPCNPSSISAVTSNSCTLANCVKKAKNDLYCGATDRCIMEKFQLADSISNDSIDEKTQKMRKMKKQPRKYKCVHFILCLFIGTKTRDNVWMAFDILCGKLDLSKAKTFLMNEIKCWANDIDNANNQGWDKTCEWADGRGQPN
jgi:hypothetical protein